MTPQETKTAWTPGPWATTLNNYIRIGVLGVERPSLHRIVFVRGPWGDGWGPMDVAYVPEFNEHNERSNANARLIAAAPTMFCALERAHVVIRDAITLRVPIDGDAEKTLKAVEKALAAALDGAK